MVPMRCFRPAAFSEGTYWRSAASWPNTREWRNCNWKRCAAPAPRSLRAPLDVSAIKLRGEEYSGRLVRVQGQIILLPNGGIALRDRFGEIPVYMLRSFFQHTSFMQRLLQGGQVEILGLARQRVNDGEALARAT